METHLQALCGELKQSVEVEVVVANSERKTIEEVIDGIKVTRLGMSFNFAAAPVCPQLTRSIREAQADSHSLDSPNAVLEYLASGTWPPRLHL